MKKIIISMISLFMLCSVVSANDVKFVGRFNTELTKFSVSDKNVRNYDFDINFRRLGNYLCLEVKDSADVKDICNGLRSGMLLAGNTDDVGRRNELILNTIDYTVKNMRGVLDDVQYKKFLNVFNLTLVHRGFSKEAYMYCNREEEKNR